MFISSMFVILNCGFIVIHVFYYQNCAHFLFLWRLPAFEMFLTWLLKGSNK